MVEESDLNAGHCVSRQPRLSGDRQVAAGAVLHKGDPADAMNLCTFTPHRGTELYDYVVSKGILTFDNEFKAFESIGQHSRENFFMEHISREKYDELLDKGLKIAVEICENRSQDT